MCCVQVRACGASGTQLSTTVKALLSVGISIYYAIFPTLTALIFTANTVIIADSPSLTTAITFCR